MHFHGQVDTSVRSATPKCLVSKSGIAGIKPQGLGGLPPSDSVI